MGVDENQTRRRARRVDFRCSSLRWITRGVRSHGALRIESTLQLLSADGLEEESYALGAGVLAANMYVPSDLLKTPPYLFQIAASQTQHVIYRTPIALPTVPAQASGNGSIAAADNSAQNDDATFESLTVDIVTEPARELTTYAELTQQAHVLPDLTGAIGFSLGCGRRIELQFPIKHMNVLLDRGMFQAETGPVLFPSRLGAGILVHEMLPSFVHFNRLDRAEFTLDFPFARRFAAHPGAPCVRFLECEVKVLTRGDEAR